MMGSGKSETGRELARLLGRAFVDCDEVVAAEAGRSIPEIFEAEGEAGFRRRESEILAEVLASTEPSVVATGGGVVTVAANRAQLAGDGAAAIASGSGTMTDAAHRDRPVGTVVCWLRARPEVLAARVGDGSGRPLLAPETAAGGALERLRRLVTDREPWYRQVADIVVDVDDLAAGEAARAVASRLGDVEGRLDCGPCEGAS